VKRLKFFLLTTLFITLFALAFAAHAQIKYVAVVETEVDAQSGAAAKLNKAEIREITTVLRNEARNNLASNKYKIMTSETVIAQGGAVLEECAEENCVIALGNKIGADYIVRGSVSKFGSKLTLSVVIYETEDGMLVASARVSSEKAEELLDMAVAACAGMYRTFAKEQSAMAVKQGAAVAQQPAYEAPAPPIPVARTAVGAVGADAGGNHSLATFTDVRDGRKYKTVTIGAKRWMAENLNYQPKSGYSWCYNDDSANCGKYGRLYDWNTAKTVCPVGWHLPSRDEWGSLAKAVGGTGNYGDGGLAGKKLKSASGWQNNGNGTDEYGFSIQPGGYRRSNGSTGGPLYDVGLGRKSSGRFYDVNRHGYLWTSTEDNGGYAYRRRVSYDQDRIDEGYAGKKIDEFSVRCLSDD